MQESHKSKLFCWENGFRLAGVSFFEDLEFQVLLDLFELLDSVGLKSLIRVELKVSLEDEAIFEENSLHGFFVRARIGCLLYLV
jgi:hypothetical protein